MPVMYQNTINLKITLQLSKTKSQLQVEVRISYPPNQALWPTHVVGDKFLSCKFCFSIVGRESGMLSLQGLFYSILFVSQEVS